MKDQFRFVVLTLSGRDLDPAQVTELLGIRPDSSCRRGDKYGRDKRAAQGYWSLTGRPARSRVETQVHSIFRRIKPVKRKFLALVERENVERAYVTIAVMPSDHAAIADYYLPGSLIREFGAFGTGMEFSIHIPGQLKRIIGDYLKTQSRKRTKI
jgi:hypothetical protein